MTKSFSYIATTPCIIQRAGIADDEGKFDGLSNHLYNLNCTDIVPVSTELKLRLGMTGSLQVWKCQIDGDLDIEVGDVLVANEMSYNIKIADKYPGRFAYVDMVMEKAK